MKLLVIGSGGREHAMAWKLAQSDLVEQVFVAPGNAGTALTHKVSNIAIDPLDFAALIHFVKQNAIQFTVVGPELPLSQGIVDAFTAAGLLCLGPDKTAAQLEASKAFAKEFMQQNGIPTAKYATFTDIAAAKAYLAQQNLPIVIKADGLASGKGVVIAQSYAEANATLEAMLTNLKFGAAGKQIVIEEFLTGIEASFIILTDGKTIVPLATAQDYKRRDDKDQGPNTGGMGAYSPAEIITPELQQKIITTIIQPTLDAIAKTGKSYKGFLYAGLMINEEKINLLEFNCRLGDPETQVILPRLNTDFAELCNAALHQKLHEVSVNWTSDCAVSIVLTAQHYPEHYDQGTVINGLEQNFNPNEWLFHSGTATQNQTIITNGGRILCATALGANLLEAKQKAYAVASKIHWPGMRYRTDIATLR